ncbi:hypothetical protein B0T17DRAFT_109921 [Bombardia bombarda]|uniref:Uncharacterized protein n=1 Tax=Bombardia bombarda TaxID=252184 RepID=A0AA39XNS4_9PEZI|nr:hypothetical protein B0T17DRAFT_109921 [Bombardia bombarda]
MTFLLPSIRHRAFSLGGETQFLMRGEAARGLYCCSQLQSSPRLGNIQETIHSRGILLKHCQYQKLDMQSTPSRAHTFEHVVFLPSVCQASRPALSFFSLSSRALVTHSFRAPKTRKQNTSSPAHNTLITVPIDRKRIFKMGLNRIIMGLMQKHEEECSALNINNIDRNNDATNLSSSVPEHMYAGTIINPNIQHPSTASTSDNNLHGVSVGPSVGSDTVLISRGQTPRPPPQTQTQPQSPQPNPPSSSPNHNSPAASPPPPHPSPSTTLSAAIT